MKVITVANQKGGVGKTTATMNMGVGLAQQGRRVLLIDSDPQANLTSYLGKSRAGTRTLDELYLAKKPLSLEELDQFICPTSNGVDLLPSDGALSGVEYYLFSRYDKETILRQFLIRIRERYDVVLIDTPPSLNLLTLNALCASRYVLIPVQPEFFSLEGLVKIRQTVESIRERFNPDLEILGVLANQVTARRKLTGEALKTLKDELGDLLFKNSIRESAAVTESSGHAKPVFSYRSRSTGSIDYVQATKEMSERIKL